MSITQQSFFASYEWYRTMRVTQPVFHDEQHASWHIFRYADVQRVLNEYAIFSSDVTRTLGIRSERDDKKIAHASLNFTDPPRHRQIRSLVNLGFTPRMVAQLEPRIQAITRELLDQAPDGMDIIRDLAAPLPVTVIAELLGIPAEKREEFKRWSDSAVAIAGPPDQLRQDEKMQEHRRNTQQMHEYFTQIIEERRQHPQNDLISGLLAADIDGERLGSTELIAFCELLLIAGNETTTHLIGNSVISFDRHPEALEQLRSDPALLPGAIEEVLRYLSPIKVMARFTSSEVMLGDQRIPARQPVMAWIASANRDEAQFPEPDHFDIQRNPNRHIAFGHGIHFCLGAPLARLEARIALTEMLKRFPGSWHLVSDTLLEPVEGMIVFGAKSLPLTWGL